MNKSFLSLLLLVSISTFLQGQFVVLDQQFKEYTIQSINSSELVDNIKSNRDFVFKTNIIGYDLQLINSNIISEDYVLRVSSKGGIREVKSNRAIPMQGSTNKGGAVSLTFNHDFVYGFIQDGDETFYIEPLRYYEKGKANDLYVVYNTKDVKESAPKTCGVTAAMEREADLNRPTEAQGGSRSVGLCFEIDYAIASDFLMFSSYGSVFATEDHAIGVTNDVQTNYDNEFADEISFFIVEQFVSDCSTCDPWTSSTNAGTLLNSFTNWGPTGFSSIHDVASLWTDRNFNGSTIGVAWLNAICTNLRYNTLQDFNNNADLKRVLTSHELGHNFAATHDGSGTPCIMAPAVQFTNCWSANSISQIEGHYLSRSCLSSCSSSSAPVADFSFTYTDQCVPGVVNFTDNSIGIVTAWSWEFPGGNPSSSNAQNPTVTYDAGGVYDATLTVFNGSLSNSLTQTGAIEILEYPTSEFDFTVNGRTVTFDNLSQNGDFYNWDFDDTNTSVDFEPIHTYVDDGVYYPSLTVSNACGSEFYTFEVVIATPPTADFTANPVSGCDPLVVNFTSTSSNNTLDYLWEFQGGSPATSGDQNPIVLFEDPGTFDVKLTVSNPQGNDSKEVVNFITVNANPEADFVFATNGTTVTFTNTSTGAQTYIWEFGDGNTSTETNPIHDYGTGGAFDVKLKAFSTTCPENETTKTINISLQPQALVSTVGATTGCTDFVVEFLDESTNTPTGWVWTFEGGTPATSTDQNPVVDYTTIGSFDVTLVATNNLGSDTIVLDDYINVSTTPTAAFGFSKTESVVNFMNQSSGATSYNWDFGDGNSSADANPTHDYGVEGTWTVVLESVNDCGSFTQTQSITTVLQPVAGFNFDNTAICPNGSVQFMDNSQNTVDSWAWTFAGGNPATSADQNPLVTYATSGTYDVSLEVTNSEGSNSMVMTGAITVLALPSADVTMTTVGNVITYTYNGNPSDNIEWTLPDGSLSSDPVVTYTALENGSFTATINVSNQCGEDTEELVTDINVYPSANINFLNGVSGCADFTSDFAAPAFVDAMYSWTFEGGSPATSTDQNPQVTYSERGQYDVSLTITNPFGTDTEIMSDAITINDLPTSVFMPTYDGAFLTLANQSEYATTYLWDFGDGNTSMDMEPTHQYQNDGTYTITLTATNECGSVESMVDLEVVVLVPSINVDVSNTSGCVPFEVTFTDMSGNNPTGFEWIFEGGVPATSTEQNPTVIYNEAGTYDVMVTMTNAAGNSSLTLEDHITVNDVPTPNFDFTTLDTEVTFNNLSSDNADSYAWDFGDGNVSDEENPVHTYANSGDYEVTLTVTNECGDVTFSSTVSVMVSSIDDLDYLTSFNLFPNPFTNQININADFSKLVSGSIEIYSNLGEKIISEEFLNLNSIKKTMSLEHLSSGVYLVKLTSVEGSVMRKVIKH